MEQPIEQSIDKSPKCAYPPCGESLAFPSTPEALPFCRFHLDFVTFLLFVQANIRVGPRPGSVEKPPQGLYVPGQLNVKGITNK